MKPAPEVISFLAVGGVGYVVAAASFNVFRSLPVFSDHHPSVSITLAYILAMVVTYVGNRFLTWRGESTKRRREIALFVLFNVIGLGFSVVALIVSHDLMGLTSRLDDNISANIIGVALGTIFRFWTYKKWVFIHTETVGQRQTSTVPILK